MLQRLRVIGDFLLQLYGETYESTCCNITVLEARPGRPSPLVGRAVAGQGSVELTGHAESMRGVL